MQQIPLPIKLKSSLVFDNFYSKDHKLVNQVIEAVKQSQMLLITGTIGKTYLLQAACNFANKQQFFYVPLKKYLNLPKESLVLEQSFQVLAVDDIDVICGNLELETMLFNLYNQAHDGNKTLLLSAKSLQLNFTLPDLTSRIKQLIVLKLPELDDLDLAQALKLQAKSRGIDLEQQVLNFLISRFPRNLKSLIAVLSSLENLSLIKNQKITVPLVKLMLEK